MPGQAREAELAQMVCVPHGHMSEDVISAIHQQRAQNFRHCRKLLQKALDRAPFEPGQLDQNNGFEGQAERFPVDIDMGSANDPGLPQLPDAFVAGRRRQAHGRSQLLVPDPAILPEMVKYFE